MVTKYRTFVLQVEVALAVPFGADSDVRKANWFTFLPKFDADFDSGCPQADTGYAHPVDQELCKKQVKIHSIHRYLFNFAVTHC